jgi:hypothetical protein
LLDLVRLIAEEGSESLDHFLVIRHRKIPIAVLKKSMLVIVMMTAATRYFIEGKGLQELIEKEMKCPKCQGEIECRFETVTLATVAVLECKSKLSCDYKMQAAPPMPATGLKFEDSNRERNTDYALNIIFVLGMIANGDGAVEAARLLGLLGLPNDTTMGTRSFGTIEDRIAPLIWDLHQEIMKENLIEEVKLTIGDGEVFNTWKSSLDDNNSELTRDNYPSIGASYDMGWNQRSQMNNSPSGYW